MEIRHESVVAKVVAFVVAISENRPERGREFGSSREALDSRARGWYFVKLALPDGRFEFEPGLHNDLRVGSELYAHNCTQCNKKTWARKTSLSRARILCCSDCWEKVLDNTNQIDDDDYDWSEHESKCDGCPTCNPTAFRDED